jgi:hypothetical protein
MADSATFVTSAITSTAWNSDAACFASSLAIAAVH